MKMWKLETAAKGNIVMVSKETVGHYFERISVVFRFFLPLCWIIYVTNEQFHQNQTI